MINNSHEIENEIRSQITEIEQEHDIELSTIQKILLCINSPITPILDVLYGKVYLFMLGQSFKKADKNLAELLELDEGEEIDYREVIVHKNGRPLTYALSYIPKSRCNDEVIEDLLKEKLTTGKIIYKHGIEILLKITNISIEKPTPTLKELFKTDEDMLTREYVMVHHGKIVIWTKESYPISFFTE